MAEQAPLERLQPALLDRLRDEDPGVTSEPREHRFMSKRQLRAAVIRDLRWLFNATRTELGAEFDGAPWVRKSVANFGLPALSGRAASSIDATELERSIRQAIIDFEPRILPNSLRVTAIVRELQLHHHNVIGLEIHGQLWSQPVPIELLLRTDVDLETGAVEVRDSAESAPSLVT